MTARDLALCSLMDCRGLGPTSLRRILASGPLDPNTFFGRSSEHYRSVYGLTEKCSEALALYRPTAPPASLSVLPVRLFAHVDPDYPSRLARANDAPPIISGYGCHNILKTGPTAAIVASSSADADALDTVKHAAEAAVNAGYAVVAGHNKPPYQLALLAAKRLAGHAVMVLDRGLLAAFEDDLRRDPLPTGRIWGFAFDTERSLAVSPFRLRDPWIGENSRKRDALVVALGDVILAVGLREAGTMHRLCKRALALGQTVLADAASLELLATHGASLWEGAWPPPNTVPSRTDG